MLVTVERVASFDLRNLLGYEVSEEVFEAHLGCLTRSTVIWLGKADGVEACAIGVIPVSLFSESAYLWMIYTKICEQHPVRFIRWSRKVRNEVLSLYPRIVGLCHPTNASGHAWLEWLGARFINHTHDGYDTFEITRMGVIFTR